MVNIVVGMYFFMSLWTWDSQLGYGCELVACMFGIDRIETTSKIIFDVVAVRSMSFAIHACVDGPSSSLAVPSKKKKNVGVCYSTVIVWVRLQRCALGEY